MGLFSAVGGLMMNLYVLGTCLFQRIQPINHVTGDPIPGRERGYGFLSRETDYGLQPDYRQCSWYTEQEYSDYFDGWMHSGRIFAFISAILATVCFLVMFLTCCMAFSPSMFERWLFWMYIVAAITIALAFLIFGSEHCSENQCKVADGSGWAISAFMFHLVAANTVKSFAGASAPSSRNNSGDDDDVDEELDDLYYEDEDEKYPPHRPEGPRGVIQKKNGEREFDNGEDYYDDLGRMVDPYNEHGNYRDGSGSDDEDLSDLDSDDLGSDEDGDELSDYDDEEVAYRNGQGDLLDDQDHDNGNLGVGYEQEQQDRQYDEYGNTLPAHSEQQFDDYGNQDQNQGYEQDANASTDPYNPQNPQHSHDGQDNEGPTFA